MGCWVELKLTWKWCLTGKSDEHFVLSKLKQLFVCPPSTLAAVKLCRLIILILFLCLASEPTLSPTFMLYDVFPQRLECLHSLSDWRCGWCHFSLKDVADLILESPHYWSSFDVVMRRFHSTLSWCLLPIPLLINDYVVHLISADSGWCHQPPQPQPQIQPNLCIADSSGARMYYILLRWSYTWEVWIPCDQSVLHWIVGDLWT